MILEQKQQNRISRLWIGLILGLVILLLATGTLYVLKNSAGGKPILIVDRQTIDYGDVKLGTPEVFSIVVTNRGADVLRFTESPYIEVLEGC